MRSLRSMLLPGAHVTEPSPPLPERPGAGLTEAEAQKRVGLGQSNRTRDVTSRGFGDILKANLLTRFNALLGSLLVVILIVGPLQDAVFGLILIFNAMIGIAQELRAKAALDRLAILTASRAVVVRDGSTRSIPAADVVLGDLVEVSAGDEIVVDGILESSAEIELNEALLTGESAALERVRGDRLLGGSFVSAGHGLYRAVRVGEATYARSLTSEARRFQLVGSELMNGINRILRIVTWAILPTAILLVVSQLRANPSLADAVRGSVAGVITLVPEGLVLLTSASLALAVIRLGRRRVLIQQLAAVEMLARCDVVCFDKTGTLTEAAMVVAEVEPLMPDVDWRAALGAIAHADLHPNPTMQAVALSFPVPAGWELEAWVPFSSARKWSAARFREQSWWVVGAPDVLVPTSNFNRAPRRALMLARAHDVAREAISGLEPVALATLSETVKPGAPATVKNLLAQGVAIKLISGDHPATVAAIAERVGLPSTEAVDARELPGTELELVDLVRRRSVFGRVTPEQKRELVHALRLAGHTVAMAGDGVNDVLGLKEADLGIAIGGGSAAARAVAACILTDGSFDGLPAVLGEGRRVIGNVERLASLFFTKTVYALLLAIAVGVAIVPFPFLPRQLTLVSAFTIGIPSAYLTLASSFAPTHRPFLRRVLSFALPVGVVAAAATFVAYVLAVNEPDLSIGEERTIATVVIASIGLWILARLARPLDLMRAGLVVTMAGGLAITLLVPSVREFFALDFPRPPLALAAVGIVAGALLTLEVGDRIRSAVVSRRRSAPSSAA